ncbi:MAG: DUF86 domain-containing protein [Methanospirillum sp.]
MPERSVAVLLEDMTDAAGRILEYTDGYDLSRFVADTRTFDAVLRNLEVLGEAAAQVPAPFRARHPGIPWRQIIGLRNVVVHRYFAVDPETVWTIVATQLPLLLPQLHELEPDTGA